MVLEKVLWRPLRLFSLCAGSGWEGFSGRENKDLVEGFYSGVELFQMREWANFRPVGGNPGKLFIQYSTDSCCEHIAGGVNLYVNLYGCLCLLARVCAACLCVCAISNQSTIKKPCHVLDDSKVMPCCKYQVPRMFRSVI